MASRREHEPPCVSLRGIIVETVAFYSYKGGVGRTLLVANTAQFLAMSGRRVVALDLDLEAPGLHQKLGKDEPLKWSKRGKVDGVVNELLTILEKSPRRNDLRKAAIKLYLPSGTTGSLFLIPAGPAPSHSYWAALEKLQHFLRLNPRNGGLPEAVLELQARIADEFEPDFLLIDSRTGITELGGLATSILADRVVCMTTTAPESIEGTKVVASALRAAPRLPSQASIKIDFLITRVPQDSPNSSRYSHIMEGFKRLGSSVAVLPHDSGIADRECVIADWRHDHSADFDERNNTGQELFSATLNWIADSFPGHKPQAEKARSRMEAVHNAWQYLTSTSGSRHGGSRSRPHWSVDQLREQVRFGKGKNSRLADIVVYEDSFSEFTSKILMIVEYVEEEDGEVVAEWWFQETRVPVVAILSDHREWKLYSIRARKDSRISPSDRWDLPLPHDFKALPDPTDVSIDALLRAVRNGNPEFLDRLVMNWVHCSTATLHGGAPWKPQVSKKIIDGLAAVEDIEISRRILWTASVNWPHRSLWLGNHDEWLDEQVLTELFAPLLWRLPPEASIDILKESGHRGKPHGKPSGLLAIAFLARDLLGLRYDPDSFFRVEGQGILERSGLNSEAEEDRGLYNLMSKFRNTEISFEISSDLPPLAEAKPEEEKDFPKPSTLETLVSNMISSMSLVTTGLLGDYKANEGRVVLYAKAISHCAEKLSLQKRHVGSVTLIHETIHALTHLGRDLDGRMWTEFALPPTKDAFFEPSFFHENLAQFFTYHQIVRLHDTALLHAFEVISAKQAPAYRSWRRLKKIPIEDVRNWFMSVRRGVGAAGTGLNVLFETMEDNS